MGVKDAFESPAILTSVSLEFKNMQKSGTDHASHSADIFFVSITEMLTFQLNGS